jgi:hypothetical protein
MTMPADVARCTGEGCPVNYTCRRYTEPPVPNHPWQRMIAPPADVIQGSVCPYFVSAIPYQCDPTKGKN